MKLIKTELVTELKMDVKCNTYHTIRNSTVWCAVLNKTWHPIGEQMNELIFIIFNRLNADEINKKFPFQK